MALVKDPLYDELVFSIGPKSVLANWETHLPDGEKNRLYFSPEDRGNINRDFKDVSSGSTYCYHKLQSNYKDPKNDMPGSILIKLGKYDPKEKDKCTNKKTYSEDKWLDKFCQYSYDRLWIQYREGDCDTTPYKIDESEAQYFIR